MIIAATPVQPGLGPDATCRGGTNQRKGKDKKKKNKARVGAGKLAGVYRGLGSTLVHSVILFMLLTPNMLMRK